MRKSFLGVLMILSLLYCSKSNDTATSGTNDKDIAENNVNKIVFVTEEYPPYEYMSGEKLIGLDIEILEEVKKLTNLDFEIKFYPWARATQMVKDGQADAIFCLIKSVEREEFLYFPKIPLSLETNRLFSNKFFEGDVKKIDQIKGKTVGVMADYSYGKEFDEYKDITKDIASDQDMLMKKLQGNRYQILINNELVTYYLIEQMGYANEQIRPLSYIAGQEPLYVAFSKKSPRGKDTFEKVSLALQTLQNNGTLETIRNKYRKASK